jgi:hypothetical protein
MSSPSTGSDTNSLSTAGQPKGSTNQKKREDIKNYKECINAVSQAYHSELTHCKDQKKKVMGGFLAQVIEKKKAEFGVSCNIPAETIRSRIKQKSLVPTHPGTSAPLYNAEMALVEIGTQMGKICQPLTCEEAIAIMNDMISETEMSDRLTQFQKVRTPNSGTIDVVCRNWWQGFKKRHASKIVSKKGEKFASNRVDWTKLSNIKQMYEYIYNKMIDAHIASPCVNPVYTDREGIEVEESDRLGLIQEMKIDHPDYILFADESGCQTNQKQDGNLGNRKYIVEHGTIPQVICSTADHRFTILPFPSGSGEAICCVIIFKHKEEEVPMTGKTGIDITVENPIRNEKEKLI